MPCNKKILSIEKRTQVNNSEMYDPVKIRIRLFLDNIFKVNRSYMQKVKIADQFPRFFIFYTAFS
jgi:hemerythrin superfamily protein